jgi:integrase
MLTKTTVDRALPRRTPYVLWDDELGGFGCRVFPSGKRSFIVQYRLPGSRKSLQVTLGPYGRLTVTEARALGRDALAKARLGEDLKAGRKAQRATEAAQASVLTVRGLAEQYIAALRAGTAATKRLRGQQASSGYIDDTILHLRRFAEICGNQGAEAITRADVVRALHPYARQPSTHRRMHGAISRMYGWARKHELVTNKPADDIDTISPPSRERVLSLNELAAIWCAAATLEHVYRDTVHLMILTGQRRAEVAGMTWGELDLERALWTLPAARTKARRQHVLPIAPLAAATLQARHAAHQRPPAGTDLVLPTLARDGKSIAPISGWNWLKRELDRASGVAEWRLHDFRRSIVSICAEHGADIGTLDTLLNPSSSATRGGIVGVYQRATLLEPMRGVMALWDRLLREALADRAPDESVVPLRAAG